MGSFNVRLHFFRLFQVLSDSVAARGGLHAGDILVKLGGKSADGMTHKDAQDAIIQSGNALEIIVERYWIMSILSSASPNKANSLHFLLDLPSPSKRKLSEWLKTLPL